MGTGHSTMWSAAGHWCTHVITVSGRQAAVGHWTQYNVVSSWTLVYTCYNCFREAGSSWALDMAKFNLVNNYLIVGVTEELGDFVAVLEATLPQFFTGATELYNSGEK